jgi:hypothetical protein
MDRSRLPNDRIYGISRRQVPKGHHLLSTFRLPVENMPVQDVPFDAPPAGSSSNEEEDDEATKEENFKDDSPPRRSPASSNDDLSDGEVPARGDIRRTTFGPSTKLPRNHSLPPRGGKTRSSSMATQSTVRTQVSQAGGRARSGSVRDGRVAAKDNADDGDHGSQDEIMEGFKRKRVKMQRGYYGKPRQAQRRDPAGNGSSKLYPRLRLY